MLELERAHFWDYDSNETPLQHLAYSDSDDTGQTIGEDDPGTILKDKVAEFLIQNGADVNLAPLGTSMRKTPLIKAAIDGRLRLAKLLLDAGADTTIRTDTVLNSQTALDIARQPATTRSAKPDFGRNICRQRIVILLREVRTVGRGGSLEASAEPDFYIGDAPVQTGEEARMERLLIDLFAEELETKRRAIETLSELRAVDQFITALRYKRCDSIRSKIISVLGSLKDNRALEIITKHLPPSRLNCCHAAIKALGELGDERAVPALIETLNVKSYYRNGGPVSDSTGITGLFELRSDVLDALRHLHAVDSLILLLAHKVKGVRWNAATNLGKLRDRRALDPLKQTARKDGDKEVREAAKGALFELGVSQEKSASQLGDDLMRAVNAGDIRAVKDSLSAGADPDSRGGPSLHTALMSAAMGGHDEIVRVLLTHGANVDMTSEPFGCRNALLLAASNSQVAATKALLDAGASVDVLDENGSTPLMWACNKGCKEVVELLLSAGANVRVANRAGMTAFHAAKSKPEILGILGSE